MVQAVYIAVPAADVHFGMRFPGAYLDVIDDVRTDGPVRYGRPFHPSSDLPHTFARARPGRAERRSVQDHLEVDVHLDRAVSQDAGGPERPFGGDAQPATDPPEIHRDPILFQRGSR